MPASNFDLDQSRLGTPNAPRLGLYVDVDAGRIHLRWPSTLTTLPFHVVRIQMCSDDWIDAEGLMAVYFEETTGLVVGSVACQDLGLSPRVAEGLRPEATVIRDGDVPTLKERDVERTLQSLPQDQCVARTRVAALLELVRGAAN